MNLFLNFSDGPSECHVMLLDHQSATVFLPVSLLSDTGKYVLHTTGLLQLLD